MNLHRSIWRAAALGLVGGIAAATLTALAAVIGLGAMAAVAPVGIVVAALVFASLVNRDRDRRVEQRVVSRLDGLSTRLKRVEGGVNEAGAIATFGTMDVPYPLPLGGRWALGWDAASILAREIAVGLPQAVVELGSGGSSLVIGMQLRRSGRGHLYTLDHEAAYAEITRRHVTALGLESWVTVLDAPLEDLDVDGERYRWYRLPQAVLGLDRIDVLVIDGPPQRIDPDGMPRYPAVPMLGARLGPGSLVFVDDAVREGEQRMLARWVSDHPEWTTEIVPTRHGTAMVRVPGSSPS